MLDRERKIFAFRPFTSYARIAKEFEAADIAFLMPHQLALIENASVDVFIAIGCLEVTTADCIEFYFRQADRLARNMYFKWWLDPEENLGGIKYPAMSSSHKVYQRAGLIPAEYVEAYFHVSR